MGRGGRRSSGLRQHAHCSRPDGWVAPPAIIRSHVQRRSHSGHCGQAQRRKVHLFNRITDSGAPLSATSRASRATACMGLPSTHGLRFEAIDTGGIVVHDQEYIPAQILHQAEVALNQACHIIFLVDGRARNHPAPTATWPRMLKRLGKPRHRGGQ